MQDPIDIIIPVFRGEAETRRCLESVLAARSERRIEVVAIDDASPEPPISAWLRELSAAGRITLISHPGNRGFVASVNEGMALHPSRDVILLNSDTEVADGWVDRLAAHASADDSIGTATPFSGNATICSYPLALQANGIPAGETTATLDAAFAVANRGRSVDIPTGVGFCLFISRRCLDAVGMFDVARYGAGYGEEVDFCMRAARAGFRNVAAGDVYVRHVGEVSFGSTGSDRRLQAQATVDALYPEFQPRLRDFLQADPLLALRRRADLERLRRSTRPKILMISHGFGGGVRRHVHDLAEAIAGECEVLVLQPGETSPVTRSQYAMLRWMNAGEAFTAWMRLSDEWPTLLELLRGLGIDRVHLHHVHGLPREVLQLPRALDCPCDMTLHDYYAICPQYHLTDGQGKYCGEPGGDCQKCEEAGPAQWPVAISTWRELFRDFVARADRIIAPSQDCAARARRYFPGATPLAWPHPQRQDAARPAAVRVVVPGALSPEKGLEVVEACARDARTRDLPLHFIVAGYVARPIATWPALPVTLTGEYPEGSMAELVAHVAPDVFFFPAQCPETHSYTLSEAMSTGLPIVATRLGALPERLARYGAAHLVPWDATAAAFNAALVDASPPRTPRAAKPAAVSLEDYARDYLAALAPSARGPAQVLPRTEERWWHDPREPQAVPTLAQLFDDGVLCGRAASLAALRTRGQLIEEDRARLAVQVEHASAQSASLHAELARSAGELEEIRQRMSALEASTSWRLLAPLRAAITALRRALR